MLIIGSRALVHNNPQLAETRKPVDWDYIATIEQFTVWHKANKHKLKFAVPTQGGKYYHCQDKDGVHYEFEIAWPGTSALMLLEMYEMTHVNIHPVVVNNNDLLAIKLSHRFKKNSPHTLKTMRDIHLLREIVGVGQGLEWMDEELTAFYTLREKESYTYSHPKLNVSSKEFFSDDNINYIYSHDALHKVVALDGSPAYLNYMKDGSEVMVDMDKFFTCSDRIKLLGGLEESLVLCAERSLIAYDFKPDPDKMFEYALQKLCTSISSGRFRSFCWENYNNIVDMYNKECKDVWVDRLKLAIANNEIALHGEE